ncbi:MAG: T9SS type A sorting domain-containing protein, partial [Flavobacterium sp.]|nr:T9SS type A sorting domain-containing protein [Flavobacterium sp.]
SDLTNNTVNFFTTLANAVDNTSALSNIISNTSNPQLIYARVTDNITGCFSLTQFNLVVETCMGVDSFNNFKVFAYPNPFENDFIIDVATANQELLIIKVYDILGRLIEENIINPSEITSQRMGQKYPSGIYYVVIKQKDEIKTLKIIKR